MDIDFSEFFQKYEAIAAKADAAFQRVKENYGEMVKCKAGCTDCCYALFDLTLIEALYLNHHFRESYSGEKRKRLMEKANRTDRTIYKLKRAAYKAAQKGTDEKQVVEEMGKERIQCPLLNAQDRCDMYPYRPIACRIYGAPLGIAGEGRTCGVSGFKPGERYPSINMDVIHEQLLILSSELVNAIGSKYHQLTDVLVPVSMAIVTDYDADYLGLQEAEEGAKSDREELGNG